MALVNIVTNHNNGAGLQKDSNLLTTILQERGHDVRKIQFDDPTARRHGAGIRHRADVNFFMELVNPHIIPSAALNVLIPNSEWWSDAAWGSYIRRFDYVWAKTLDCHRIWLNKVQQPSTVRLIGWEAPDLYDPDIPRQIRFLHCAGKSETKNTAAVMEAWRVYKIPYPITVSAFKPNIVKLCQGVPNVTHVHRFPEEAMKQVMNQHLFHVMPSKYEGFGMAIHEALGCGGVVLTTDAAPMREFAGVDKDLLLPVTQVIPTRAARFNIVSSAGIAEKVHLAAGMSDAQLHELINKARAGFEADRAFFNRAIARELEVLKL